jgi:hypothetical protein
MSYVLSGYIVPDLIENARRTRDRLGLALDVVSVGSDCTMFTNRNRQVFGLNDTAIRELLRQYGKLLTVLWDDRSGLRASIVHGASGEQLKFGADEELYVELDDQGFPILNGKVYSLKDVETSTDDKEFETCKNAVELGCEASGFCQSHEVMEFIRCNK